MNNTNPDGTKWSPASPLIYEMMKGVNLTAKDKKKLDEVRKSFPPNYVPSWDHRAAKKKSKKKTKKKIK